MKRFFTIFSILLVFCFTIQNSLFAEFVEIRKARQVAGIKIEPGFTINFEKAFNSEVDMKPLFYVFELNPKGYVVVSGDTDLPPIIAYSYDSNYEIPGDLQNPLTDLLMADLQNRKNNISNIPDEIILERNLEWENLVQSNNLKSDGKSYGPYLETAWGQGTPYNNYCPMDPTTNQRCIAGCPAVAMAQIINYYETINETVFTDLDDYYHSYAGINFWIDDDFEEYDFPPFPILNAHLDTLVECWQNETSLKDNEKAALNFACGVACKQVYTSSIAGTFGVNQAYDAYLRFGFNEAVLVDENDTSLYSKLIQNMINGQPAHLAVVDQGWTMGHNLVVDGYNENDGFFHLNFGWDGYYNGYYYLPDGMPYGLTVIEGLILNIADPPVSTNVPYSSELSYSEKIRIYPNPAQDFIKLDFTLKHPGSAEIIIYSLDGSVVRMSLSENLNEGSNTIYLDFNKWEAKTIQAGMYFCQIRSNEEVFKGKFIVR